jgi:phosphotriesterase-related protein
VNEEMRPLLGQVLTARGPVDPEGLGTVMMHEHLHCDLWDPQRGELVQEERPMSEERRAYLLQEAVPYLRRCAEHGCGAFVETTMPPWRAWPDFYVEASEASGLHIVLCTGFYREIELGTYFVTEPRHQMWGWVGEASVDQLEEMCIREIVEGIHGTKVRAGCIKLGTSQPEMTEKEEKTFRAGARAQRKTGVPITTHCTTIGAESSQLEVLDEEGVDLSRVIIGHTAAHLVDPECHKTCLEWMRRGANFLPTNLGIEGEGERWRPLVEAIHEVFAAGHGDKLSFGLDWAFTSGTGQTEDGSFQACNFVPPPPFLHLYTHTLPAFRRMGLREEEERAIMQRNPQRVLPIA